MTKLLIIIIFFFYPSLVYAYLDPVTGTAIIQGIFLVAATIIFYIRNPKRIWGDLKKFFFKIKMKITKNEKDK
tara:strand:+ start:32020 stop:32238 length:219 start_codon:yes stop_codon:yes gene_type:complete